MTKLRKACAVPVLAFLALVATTPARAWCVDTPGVSGACDSAGPCNNHNTHEHIALLAAQNGGDPTASACDAPDTCDGNPCTTGDACAEPNVC